MRTTPLLLPSSLSFPQSTGLVGLPVHPTPRTALLSLYRETLAELKQCPADAAYTKSVAAITEQRLAVVEANEEAAAIEQRLDAGCIEEVICVMMRVVASVTHDTVVVADADTTDTTR